MRWLITGAGGQLGTDLRLALSDASGSDASGSDEIWALTRAELDIADSTAVAKVLADFAPDVVVNAAAYTAVDVAESDEEAAYRVNATGPAVLANALAGSDAKLIHVSTDYVFAGDAEQPYEVDAAPAPRSAYGRTKLAGEQAVRELLPERGYVVRTAWVYGAHGKNFVKTMARVERERDTVSVVDDQRGSPSWTADLAAGLVELGRSDAAAGAYHCTNGGDTTWCGLARAVFEELGADPARVLPITSADYPAPAPRPAYSVLSDAAWRAAGLAPLPPWRDALRRAFATSGDALTGGGA
jgi:dTDP-4-dehydrorhamnose reductase